jgi:hypothetical protein
MTLARVVGSLGLLLHRPRRKSPRPHPQPAALALSASRRSGQLRFPAQYFGVPTNVARRSEATSTHSWGQARLRPEGGVGDAKRRLRNSKDEMSWWARWDSNPEPWA